MLKVIHTDNNSQIFEVDKSMYKEVLSFLKSLSKEKKKSFSYIDELGDTIVVLGDKEYVIPTREDIESIFLSDRNDFIDENILKKELNV